MEILHSDENLIVCIKPAGVLSTDESGGLPDLLRTATGEQNFRTVHRLDAAVSGLMLLAKRRQSASDLGRQVMERGLGKEYLAIVHGCPGENSGLLRDNLWRDKARRMSFALDTPGPETQTAELFYEVLASRDGLSLVRIELHTGRTHQIRVQFSSRDLPLWGDKKYGKGEEGNIALWSYRLRFTHPKTGEEMDISAPPPAAGAWSIFERELKEL